MDLSTFKQKVSELLESAAKAQPENETPSQVKIVVHPDAIPVMKKFGIFMKGDKMFFPDKTVIEGDAVNVRMELVKASDDDLTVITTENDGTIKEYTIHKGKFIDSSEKVRG